LPRSAFLLEQPDSALGDAALLADASARAQLGRVAIVQGLHVERHAQVDEQVEIVQSRTARGHAAIGQRRGGRVDRRA
jgi:hypothetical protein